MSKKEEKCKGCIWSYNGFCTCQGLKPCTKSKKGGEGMTEEWKKRCDNCRYQNLSYDDYPCVYCKYNQVTQTRDMWSSENS